MNYRIVYSNNDGTRVFYPTQIYSYEEPSKSSGVTTIYFQCEDETSNFNARLVVFPDDRNSQLYITEKEEIIPAKYYITSDNIDE